MWIYFHKWFGWDYILMNYGLSSRIFRVKKAPNGLEYVVAYGEVIPRSRWRTWLSLTQDLKQPEE